MPGVSGLFAASLLLPWIAPYTSPEMVDEARGLPETRSGRETRMAGPDPLASDVCKPRHFAVHGDSGTPRERTDRILDVLERTHAVFYRELGRAGFELKPLSEPLVWLVFADRAEFGRYMRQAEGMEVPDLDGYYSPRTNRVALLFRESHAGEVSAGEVKPAVAGEGATEPLRRPNGYIGERSGAFPRREAHEAAHQLAFNSGLQKRGVMYPFWVAEGLATAFETDSGQGPGAINVTRCRHLLAARRKGSLVPLYEFLVCVQVRLENTQRVQETYGQAWGVFHYLFTQHPARLREYLRSLAEYAPGQQSLVIRRKLVAEALGPPDELEAGWQALLDRLEANTVPDDPVPTPPRVGEMLP